MKEIFEKNKNIVISVMVVFLVIGIGVLIAFSNTDNNVKPLSTYSKNNEAAPKVVVSEGNFDLGEVPYTLPTDKTITVKNEGESVLQLTDFKTSCGCTSVVLKIPGMEDSPKFEMHNNPTGYVGEIAAGKEAELDIKFDPKAHNITGKVERTVFFNTNDPNKEKITITFKADVREN